MKRLIFLILFITFVAFFSVVIFREQLQYKHLNLITPFSKENVSTFRVSPHLSINDIFLDNHNWLATLSADKKITLIATGDVIPARSVNYQTTTKNNFIWPFEKTADVLKKGDITLINLESPLVKDCPITQSGMVFCGDEQNIKGLLYAGVDVANLSNNHLGNYGMNGINNTVNILNSNGIITTGVSGPVYKEIKGIKFAFLGYGMIAGGEMLSWIDENKIKSEINLFKRNSDVVVVLFHWGDEYTTQPNEKQRKFAHLAMDSGADLVIGNHPHWIQPVEIYKNKIIMYAHGNFIFDQMWSEKTEEGVVGKYVFYGKDLVDVEFLPVKIVNYGQPYFLEGKQKVDILNELKDSSLEVYNNQKVIQ